jgi:CBS domain-containing protein
MMLYARNLMHSPVSTVGIDDTLHAAISCMQRQQVSGLPVVDHDGQVVGMLTEGDLLRRAELGTEKVRTSWLDFFVSSGARAEEYTHAHSQLVADVMTRGAIVIAPELPLEEVVRLMQSRHVKRLPVVDGKTLVGIVSRHDLMMGLARSHELATATAASRAAASTLGRTAMPAQADAKIFADIHAQLETLKWGCRESLIIRVASGAVTLGGMITDGRERPALHALASNTAGVTSVIDELTWVDLTTGTVLDGPGMSGATFPLPPA